MSYCPVPGKERSERLLSVCARGNRMSLLPTAYINAIAEHVGQEVTLAGWVYHKTEKGRLIFIQLRDGTGTIQCVVFKKNVSEEVFDAAKSLTQESSVRITGTPRPDERAPSGYELDVTGVDPVHVAQDYLNGEGFVRFDTPILTPVAAEGTSNLFATQYFDLGTAYLAQTGQLYVEAGMMSFGKVYCFGPTFRAEQSKTRRHLTEFWMIEPELAFADQDDNMVLQENFISAIVQRVLKVCRAEREPLERTRTTGGRFTPPFPRISYDEAVERINAAAKEGATVPPEGNPLPPLEWGEDFGAPHETFLAEQFDRPVFVVNYPAAVKAFYMQPVDGRPEVVRCADLLAPEGYGEIIGGSQRIHDAALLEQRIRESGLDPEHCQWYLDLRRYGTVPHSGFGMGIERCTAWIAGTRHIRETIPFPRQLYRIY